MASEIVEEVELHTSGLLNKVQDVFWDRGD